MARPAPIAKEPCIGCGGPRSIYSTGRCQRCCNQVAYRSPEGRERLSKLMREQRQDPWFIQAMEAARRERWAR